VVIPFVIAIGYGVLGSRSDREVAKGAFVFSFVGATIGVVAHPGGSQTQGPVSDA
jgi:hypothetical protein